MGLRRARSARRGVTKSAAASFRLIAGWMGWRSSMLHDLREIPVIDPFATLLALYEMLGPVFRDNAESHSKISWEVTHGAIDPWAVWQGYPPTARSTFLWLSPSSLPTTALGLPRLISNFIPVRRQCEASPTGPFGIPRPRAILLA
jgi:hypothetical protein